jgi:dihydrofolate synthase / folylpolyglutamate synthase
MYTELAYNQALDYLYSFVDYSLKKASELARAEFKLERMTALLERLGNPQRDYPSIHVAGTKGKGSTSALIAAALSAGGYRTGLYISPHLQDFAERIQVDGVPIPHGELADLMEEIKPAVAGVAELSTFEITTALGFLYFSRRNVEAAVIEVGLGGRLDATNVITPRVAVITSLSYDHMAVLGNTLTLIAGEKAGIIKAGVPVVSSPQVEEALKVLEHVASERQSPLTLVGRDLHVTPGEHTQDGQTLSIEYARDAGKPVLEIKNPVILRIPLLGEHQVRNAATAYAALKASGLELSEQAIRDGFANVKWPCRFEVAQREPPLIFDSAHNRDSFEKLSRTLEDYFPGRGVILIFGASEDKDMEGMLAILQGKLSCVIATRAEHPRALDPALIAEAAGRLGLKAESVEPVRAALERAMALASQGGEVVLSAGSMFVTAEVKTAWQTVNAV